MSSEKIYKEIIGKIKDVLQKKKKLHIEELLSSNILKKYRYENLIAIIKLLISSGNLLVQICDGKHPKFERNIVHWNFSQDNILIPKKEPLQFDQTSLCITLPPFTQFGLTNQMRDHSILMNTLLEEFIHLFSLAKYSIKICSPFIEYNGFKYFKDIILEKARKKVKIDILSREISIRDNISRHNDLKKIFEIFRINNLENKIDIRNYYFNSPKHNLLSSIHAKLIIIDDKKAYIGSGEIRENRFKKNLELGVIISGSKVIELSLIYEKIFNKSEVISFS